MSETHKQKIGLALGGGSARGWAHIGVIRELQKAGVEPDIIAGTSAGALVGGAYAAGYLDQLEEFARSLRWKDILGFLDPTLGSGLFQGKKLFRFFEKVVTDVSIEDLSIPFAATATDLNTGHEIWLQSGSLGDAVRASISLPGLLTPVHHKDRWLVDGGLVNPVPVSLARAMGADIIIAVELTSFAQFGTIQLIESDEGELQQLESKISKPGRSWIQSVKAVSRRLRGKDAITTTQNSEKKQKRPTILDVVSHSTFIMQSRITRTRLAVEPPEILLTPPVSEIGLMEFHRAGTIIDAGVRSARHAMDSIRSQIG